jgi:hypothetical protein
MDWRFAAAHRGRLVHRIIVVNQAVTCISWDSETFLPLYSPGIGKGRPLIIDQIAPQAQRADLRMKVLLGAELVTPFGRVSCRVHDISRGGACLETDAPLAKGVAIRFRRDGIDAAATIAWARGRRIGIRFDAPIRATDLLVQMSRSRRDQAPLRLSAPAANAPSAPS